MTNFEWLKSLSIEEIVDERILSCSTCIYKGNCEEDKTKTCSYGWNQWLKSEYKEGLDV